MASENETVADKRETYLCGYDPGEALVMQCGTCRYYHKAHSHCDHHDSLTNAKYTCNAWKFKMNRKQDGEVGRLRSEIAELRKGISELLDALQTIYNEECTDYGTGEVYDKWRKALEGANDGK